jgi:hypothetical protein
MAGTPYPNPATNPALPNGTAASNIPSYPTVPAQQHAQTQPPQANGYYGNPNSNGNDNPSLAVPDQRPQRPRSQPPPSSNGKSVSFADDQSHSPDRRPRSRRHRHRDAYSDDEPSSSGDEPRRRRHRRHGSAAGDENGMGNPASDEPSGSSRRRRRRDRENFGGGPHLDGNVKPRSKNNDGNDSDETIELPTKIGRDGHPGGAKDPADDPIGESIENFLSGHSGGGVGKLFRGIADKYLDLDL